MKKVYWSGICDNNRLICISLLEECIRKYGFITDYKFFSDISMSILIETKERNLKVLYDELLKSIKVTTKNGLDSDSDAECMIFFNVTFTSGTGILRIEVPHVPG